MSYIYNYIPPDRQKNYVQTNTEILCVGRYIPGGGPMEPTEYYAYKVYEINYVNLNSKELHIIDNKDVR